MYLSSLRGLVPELSHPTQVQASASGHFSLLQVREKQGKMPFLNEVFEHVYQPTLAKKSVFNKRVSHWYPTSEPAETTVFKNRTIPRVLRQFVPQNQLAEGGASSFSARIRPNSIEGVKEAAAISSQAFASSGI